MHAEAPRAPRPAVHDLAPGPLRRAYRELRRETCPHGPHWAPMSVLGAIAALPPAPWTMGVPAADPTFGGVPLMDARWSMRNACKEAILLCHHLTLPMHGCADCIRKHFLAFEGYLEEALNLNPEPALADYLQRAIPHVQWCAQNWADGMDPSLVAHGLRDIRKFVQNYCFDVVRDADFDRGFSF